jgi:kynurenine formamidase
MANLIDLSIPIEHGAGRLGLQVDFATPFKYEDVNWQGSTFSMFCHYGSHVDAPNHFLEGGKGIDQVPLASLVGPAAVIDLSDHGEGKGIAGDTLEDRGRHLHRGDIAILRTDWTDRAWGSEVFWSKGPYLAPSGAEWLVARGVKAVVYDFAEEYVVRNPGFRGEDCEVHHKILGSDVYNIEYVRHLGKISTPRVTLVAFPLNLVGLDGAPARVVAIEGVELPSEFSIK